MIKIIYIVFFASFLSMPVFPQDSAVVTLELRVFLQGVFHDGEMETTLADKNLIPLSQPYNVFPWEYNGSETTNNIPDDVVDWILVELSKKPDESGVANRKACFIKSNGDIFDINNQKGIKLRVQKEGSYYVIVHHRNHLSVISSHPLTFSGSTANYDFTKSESSAFGNSSLADLGGVYGLRTGDSDANGIINSLDFKAIGEHIFSKGYINCDLDMNGVVNVLDYGQTNNNISKKSFIPAKAQF